MSPSTCGAGAAAATSRDIISQEPPEHDMGRLAVLVVARLRVRVAVDGLHLPLGILECHFFVPLFFEIHLLFALPLSGKRAFLVRLVLSLVELFCELLDLPTLTHAMARSVMHRASGTAIVAAGHLTMALVASWASAPTYRHSYSCAGSSQRLVVTAGLVVVVVAAAATLSGNACIGLAVLAFLRDRRGVPCTALWHPGALVCQAK
jgi:hypothetical protein